MRRFALIALILSIAVSGCGDSTPQLLHDDAVPDDLRSLADDTWADLLETLPERHDCFEGPTLHAAWELDTRAEYQPATQTLSIRVPGTPATLRSELLHEFAHHIEFSCTEQELLRPAFMEAQGFPADADWFEGDTWETTPSEQYAEALVELIEGRRTHTGGILLTDKAIAVIRDWGERP